MSIRLKLLVSFALLAAAVLGLTLVAVRMAVADLARANIEADFDRTARALQSDVEARLRAFENAVTATMQDVFFVKAMTEANDLSAELGLADPETELAGLSEAHDTIASADLPLLKGSEVMAVVNARGHLVFSKHDPRAFGVSLASLPVVAAALARGHAEALWSPAAAKGSPARLLPPEFERELMLVHARRIERSKPLGVLLVGYRMGEAVVGELEQLARGSVALIAADGGMAARPGSVAARLGGQPQTGPAVSVELDGRRHLVRVAELSGRGGLGRALLTRDLDAEIRPVLSRFQRRLLLIAAVVLVLSGLASALTAGRLSRPLIALGSAARRVGQGDLGVRLPPMGTDEVGRLAVAFNEMVAGLRQRDQIKGLFKRYLSPNVVDELLKHPEKASPGGERRALTVLFADLVGFTSLAEVTTPEALVSLLNEYLEEATRAVVEQGATVDKFIGDAVMCFWNAPLPQARHAAQACLAALELSRVVDRLSGRFLERTGRPLGCRIGLNTGPCIVGNIGSKEAQDYTVIGDSVNLASRLEGAARAYGVRILASEATIREAGDAVVARELDVVRVKGRHEPVRIYTLLGERGTPAPESAAKASQGLALYRERRFAEALQVLTAAADDGPARAFAERCRRFLRTPPPPDWDGVHALEEK